MNAQMNAQMNAPIHPAGQGPLIRVAIWPESVFRFGIPLNCSYSFDDLVSVIYQMDSKNPATSSICIHMPADGFMVCGVATKITASNWTMQLVQWLLQSERYILAHFYDRIPSRIFVPANVFAAPTITASPTATLATTTPGTPSPNAAAPNTVASDFSPQCTASSNTAVQITARRNFHAQNAAAPNTVASNFSPQSTASSNAAVQITARRNVHAQNAAALNTATSSTAVLNVTATYVPAASERFNGLPGVWKPRRGRPTTASQSRSMPSRPISRPPADLDSSSEDSEPPNKKQTSRFLRRPANKSKSIILRLTVSSRTQGFHPLDGWRQLKLSLPATADFDDIHHAIIRKLEIQLSDTAIVDSNERLKNIGVETVIGNQVLLESGPSLEGYAEASADAETGGQRRRGADENGEKELSGRVELWLEIGQVVFQTYEQYIQSKAQDDKIKSTRG